MVISSRNGEALRENSRSLGLVFQVLSVLSIAATLYATVRIHSVGSQYQIGSIAYPIAWFVFLGGLFTSLVLAGFGHVLGMLCALYDRQELLPKRLSNLVQQPTATSQEWRQRSSDRPTVWEKVVEKDVDEVIVRPATAPPVESLSPGTSSKKTGGLWEWLSRDRHFTSKKTRRNHTAD